MVVFALLEWIVEPRLIGRQHYSLLLIVLVTLMLIWWAGFVAIVVGPPVAVAIEILATQLLYFASVGRATSPAELRQRLEEISQRHSLQEGAWPRDVANIIERLRSLLNDAESLPQPAQPAAVPPGEAAS